MFATVGGPKVVPGKEGVAPADGDGDSGCNATKHPKLKRPIFISFLHPRHTLTTPFGPAWPQRVVILWYAGGTSRPLPEL
ncbi:hypothetical protein V2G26_003554 [Clonostachys chloroleuca]